MYRHPVLIINVVTLNFQLLAVDRLTHIIDTNICTVEQHLDHVAA